jgi:hypothetical protein
MAHHLPQKPFYTAFFQGTSFPFLRLYTPARETEILTSPPSTYTGESPKLSRHSGSCVQGTSGTSQARGLNFSGLLVFHMHNGDIWKNSSNPGGHSGFTLRGEGVIN